MLRELADVIERLLFTITERLWQSGKVSEDCEIANVTAIFNTGKEDPGNNRSVNHILFPERWCYQFSWKPFPNIWRTRGSCQHEFRKRKSCLANLIAFFKEITRALKEGRIGDDSVLILVRLSTLSPVTSSDKMIKYGLDKWTVT